MLKKISCSFIIVIALAGNMSCSVSKARQVTPTAVQLKTVSDITELNKAIASAKPGSGLGRAAIAALVVRKSHDKNGSLLSI